MMSLAELVAGVEQAQRDLAALRGGETDATMLAAQRDTCSYPEYADDPVGFCRDVLGEGVTVDDVLSGKAHAANAPWQAQVDILESVRDHPRTVVRASNGVGKTYIAARVGIWWLYTHVPSIVITTAPKATQVRDLLWARWRSAWTQAVKPLPGRCLTTRCDPLPADTTWYALGHTARDAEAFSGYHEAHVLMIFDEAPGVAAHIWDATEGILSSGNARILAIGNPLSRTGPYYRAHLDATWHQLHISAYDHPNVVHQRPVYPSAVTPSWPAERLAAWGAKHPLYLSRVVGEFPDDAEDTLIPLSWIEAAVGREVDDEGATALGVDVARFGLNETVVYLVQGHKATMLDAVTGRDTAQTAGRLLKWLPLVAHVGVDDAGVGGGVVDILKQDSRASGRLMPFNAGAAPRSGDDFDDLGSEAMWAIREACREAYEDPKGRSGIGLPDDQELIAQLAGRTYQVTHKGRIKIEPKDELRRRGEKSPDRADALAIAWWAAHHRPPKLVLGNVIG
jgi:phage terminase large subunit